MTCIKIITSTSNTLKYFVINKSFPYSYIKREFNEKEEMINNIFSSYFEPLLKKINHPELLQGWKLNIDAEAYENKLMLICINLLIKNKLIVIIATCTAKTQ